MVQKQQNEKQTGMHYNIIMILIETGGLHRTPVHLLTNQNTAALRRR